MRMEQMQYGPGGTSAPYPVYGVNVEPEFYGAMQPSYREEFSPSHESYDRPVYQDNEGNLHYRELSSNEEAKFLEDASYHHNRIDHA